jgi:hypothetical protein
MSATRKSPHASDAAHTEARDEIIGIVAAGLARLIQTDRPPATLRHDTLPNIPAANLSESAEVGLELSGETGLSVPAG